MVTRGAQYERRTKRHNCHNVNWNLQWCFEIFLILHNVLAFESLWSDYTTNIWVLGHRLTLVREVCKSTMMKDLQIFQWCRMIYLWHCQLLKFHMLVVSFKSPSHKCNFYLTYLTCCMHFKDQLRQLQLVFLRHFLNIQLHWTSNLVWPTLFIIDPHESSCSH